MKIERGPDGGLVFFTASGSRVALSPGELEELRPAVEAAGGPGQQGVVRVRQAIGADLRRRAGRLVIPSRDDNGGAEIRGMRRGLELAAELVITGRWTE